jgi:hypothetical protein
VDIAAYLVDGSFDWVEMSSSLSMDTGSHETMHNVLPVLDRCGMFILLEQVCETFNDLDCLQYFDEIDSFLGCFSYVYHIRRIL